MNVFSKHLSKTPIIPIRPKTPLASSSTSSVSFSNALSNSDEREQPVVECSDTNGSSESDPSSKSSSKLVVGRHQPFPYHKFDHYIPKELKWFFMGPCPEIPFSATTPGAAGSATTPTYTGYSAGVSRGICIELLKHINPGDNQGQRQGSEIFVKRVQFSFKFYSTNARRVSAAIELRDYPIRVIAHRYKVAPFGAIAVDITPNSSTLYPMVLQVVQQFYGILMILLLVLVWLWNKILLLFLFILLLQYHVLIIQYIMIRYIRIMFRLRLLLRGLVLILRL